jgi:hypothetical protein
MRLVKTRRGCEYLKVIFVLCKYSCRYSKQPYLYVHHSIYFNIRVRLRGQPQSPCCTYYVNARLGFFIGALDIQEFTLYFSTLRVGL